MHHLMGTATADVDRKASVSPTASRLRARSLRACVQQRMPSATLMDQIAPICIGRTRTKPHLALVMASIAMAVGLWFVIYAASGHLIWFW